LDNTPEFPIKTLNPKIKFVKAEKSNAIKIVNVFNTRKRFDNQKNKFLSITEYLINGHHAKLRKIKEEEEELKNKERLLIEENLNKNIKQNASKMSRKTEVLFVDSDGDVIVGTEDELDNYFTESSQKPLKIKENNSGYDNSNNSKTPKFNQIDKSLDNNFSRVVNNFGTKIPENVFNSNAKLSKDFINNKQINKFNHNIYNAKNQNNEFLIDNIVLRLLEEPKNKILEAFKKSIININDIADSLSLVESLFDEKRINIDQKALYIQKLENLLDIFISIENKNEPNAFKKESFTMNNPNQKIDISIENSNTSISKLQIKKFSEELNPIEYKKSK
jgi:hypothetical protein